MHYDESRDVKPSKGAKSVQQNPLNGEEPSFNDSKSEGGILLKTAVSQTKPAAHQKQNQEDLKGDAKHDKYESQSASGAPKQKDGGEQTRDFPEESKSVSFADDPDSKSQQLQQKKKRKKARSKMSKLADSENPLIDGESEVDRLVEESKEAIERNRRSNSNHEASESQSASSLSSYDKIEGKGRYKCRACVQGFMSKKLLEKHRKTLEHKIREKKYS